MHTGNIAWATCSEVGKRGRVLAGNGRSAAPGIVRRVLAGLLAGAALFGLAGCATGPQQPVEPVGQRPARVAPPVFDPVPFNSGAYELNTAARSSLRAVAATLRSAAWAGWPIEIEGHSDQRGDEQANLRISERRADAVARELEFNGVDRERMVVRAFGEARPLQVEQRLDGSTDRDAAAANRRVEILLVERP